MTIFDIITSTGLLASIIASVYPTTIGIVRGDKYIGSDGNSRAASTCKADKKSGFFIVTQSRYVENIPESTAALKQALSNLGIGRN